MSLHAGFWLVGLVLWVVFIEQIAAYLLRRQKRNAEKEVASNRHSAPRRDRATIVGMKEPIGVFLSIAAIIGGIVLLYSAFDTGDYLFTYPLGWPEVRALLGVLLLAAGVTRFYLRSHFHKEN